MKNIMVNISSILWSSYFVPLLIIATLISIPIYMENNPKIISEYQVYESENVHVYYSKEGGGVVAAEGIEKIINMNEYPVIIRCVWKFKGETTLWVEKLKPKQNKNFNVSHQHGFYIYTDSSPQKLIGFVAVNNIFNLIERK